MQRSREYRFHYHGGPKALRLDEIAIPSLNTNQVLVKVKAAGVNGDDSPIPYRAAIDAAKTAGVRRMVYTNYMGANASSVFPPMHIHAVAEDMLRGHCLDRVPQRLVCPHLADDGGRRVLITHVSRAAGRQSVIGLPCGTRCGGRNHTLAGRQFDGPTPPLIALEQ